MESKILFIDIDGTLVDYQDRLPKSAARAVREARANGHRTYACTGRPMAQIRDELRDLGFDGYIAGGGNYVEDAGAVVFFEPLPVETEKALVDWFQERGMPFYVEANSGLFTSSGFETDALPALVAYGRDCGMRKELRSVDDVVSGFIHGRKNLYLEDVNKISFPLLDPSVLDRIREAFPDLRVGTWGGLRAGPFFGEIGVATSKAEGIRKLMEHAGMDWRGTIGFGDTHADIPMLQTCGIGVAMGNSPADVKAAADYVAGDVEEDGLYEAFRLLGLLGDA